MPVIIFTILLDNEFGQDISGYRVGIAEILSMVGRMIRRAGCQFITRANRSFKEMAQSPS